MGAELAMDGTTWTARYMEAHKGEAHRQRYHDAARLYHRTRQARLRAIAARWDRYGRPDTGMTNRALRILAEFGTNR